MAVINLPSYPPEDDTMMSHEFPASLRSERILLASESLGPINGVSRTTTNLILSLQAQDVPLKLVAPYYTKSQSKSTKPTVDLGPIRRLGGAPLPYTPELTVAYPFRLDRICGKFKPTLIYLASPASVGFQVLFQLRALHNPPVIMANFQTDLSAYAGIIFPPPLDKWFMWLLQFVEGWLYSHPCVHTVFYPSRPVRDYLVEAGVPEERLVHLGRGVDTISFNPIYRDETWRREELRPTGNEIVLVSVGRLAPEKGFPFLASAMQKLAATNVSFCLLVVGGNRNQSVETQIKQAFAPLGPQRVRFTGFLEGEALARAYASADAFLHCSVTETFGLVVLEAMACGLPVVARDAGGPSEIVRDGISGFLTAPEDEDGFVAKVKQLSEDKELRERMGVAARRQAEATTWDAINLRVAQRMQSALDEKRLNSSARHGSRFLEDGVGSNSQALNWILAFGGAVLTELKFTWAMSVVCFFWFIGVVPLLIHGNLMFAQPSGDKSQTEGRTKIKDDGGETGRVNDSRRQWERTR